MNTINYILKYQLPSYGENFLPTLSAQNKKILTITTLAFACLAFCYYYFKAKNLNKEKQIKIEPPTKVEKEKIEDGVNNHNQNNQKNVGVIPDQLPPTLPHNEESVQEQSLVVTNNPDVNEEKKITKQLPPLIPSHSGLVDVIVPQQVPRSNTEQVFNLLPKEILFHLFSFLKVGQIVKLSSVSRGLNNPVTDFLNSFEGKLLTAYQLTDLLRDRKKLTDNKKKKECLEKRKEYFDLLLDHPHLKKHFENVDNRKIFFNHMPGLSNYDYKNLSKDKLKIVQDLYFEFATDKKLKEFISIFTSYNRYKFSHATNFISSLEKSHLKRLSNLVANPPELDILKFLLIFTIEGEPYSPLFFDIINILFQAKPDSLIWKKIIGLTDLRPFVMAVYILREFTTSNHPNFDGLILLPESVYPFDKYHWIKCFEVLAPRIERIEENKRKALMDAIFSCNITACYKFIMYILETNNSDLIFSFLKEFLSLNHAQVKPEIGLAYVFKSIETKEQAIALIKGIQTLPPKLQTLHFRELHNQILLINKQELKLNGNSFFGRNEPQDFYQDWDTAFRTCGLELKDYERLKGDEFNVGCQNYKLGK